MVHVLLGSVRNTKRATRQKCAPHIIKTSGLTTYSPKCTSKSPVPLVMLSQGFVFLLQNSIAPNALEMSWVPLVSLYVGPVDTITSLTLYYFLREGSRILGSIPAFRRRRISSASREPSVGTFAAATASPAEFLTLVILVAEPMQMSITCSGGSSLVTCKMSEPFLSA